MTFMKRILEQIHVVRFDNVWINFKEFPIKPSGHVLFDLPKSLTAHLSSSTFQ